MKSSKGKKKSKTQVVKVSLKGKGDYNMTTNEFNQLVSRLDKIDSRLPSVKNGLGVLGSKVGGMFGNSSIGKKLGEGAASLLGFGDYNIVSNSLMKGVETSDGIVPKFVANSNGIRVREREFIGDVVSGSIGVFKNTVYPISPTSAVTFPWLSTFAKQFDQWEPNGVVFEFVSTSSDFNGSAQGLGSVVMATDYDVLDPPYGNKVIMDNADYASSTKPSNNLVHGVECDPSQRPYKTMYCRSFDAEAANRNTLGNFQLATAGVSASNVSLGELWVSYDITFYKKQLDGVQAPMFSEVASYNTGTSSWTETPIFNVVGWKTYIVPQAPNQLQIAFPVALGKGRFLAIARASVYPAFSPLWTALQNCTVVYYNESGPAAAPFIATAVIDVTAEKAVCTIVDGGVSSSIALALVQVPDTYAI